MGSGSKSQTVGYRYYMSLHMGIGRGPVDEVVQIKAGDMNIWPVPEGSGRIVTVAEGPDGTGVALYSDDTSATVPATGIRTMRIFHGTGEIRAGNIFGGEKKEGGVEGSLQLLRGHATQIVPAWIKTLLGGRVPEFRGVTTLFFDGLVCMINPYPKPWKIRVRRTTSGWDGDVWQPTLATIWMRDGTIKAMNPMHIIYECLTNRDWGRGYPRAWLNDPRLTEIAQVLFDENFGMCLRWARSGELGEFIQMVIDHIGGSLYVDRTNGLISMDLLRADYDPVTLPTFTYSTGLLSIEEAETSSQEDIINEVIVTWKDPIKDQERQVRVHNLASLQASDGGKNSSKTDYAGAPVPELAARLAQRDLKANATSLKRFKVTLDRRAWRIKPGDVFRVAAPDKDVYNVVLRAGKVNSGTNTDGKITVEAVLDVFGLPASSFLAQPPSEWQPPSRVPVPADRLMVREATYRDLVLSMGPGDLQTVTDDSGAIATLVAKPTDLSQGYNLATQAAGEEFVQRGSGTFLPTARTATSVTFADSTIAFTDAVDMGLVRPGIAVQVGPEIVSLIDIDAVGNTMTVGRGCVDTVPRAHSAGSDIFFIIDEPGSDDREYVMGESVQARVLPYTSSSQLEQIDADTLSVAIAARQGRPWPPANVRVNGEPLSGSGGAASGGNQITLTWAHRDRKIIQDQLLPHGSASVGPEPGTTYTIRVYQTEDSVTPVRTVSGLTGTTWTYTNAMASADGLTDAAWFELESRRNGMTSFQRYRFNVTASFTPVVSDELVVQASNPGATAFPNNSFTRVPFFTETLDPENAFSSNDRYTAPTGGTYRFVVEAGFAGASSPLPSGATWDLKIDNVSAPSTEPVTGQSSAGTYDGSTSAQLSVTIALNAGDMVSAYLRHGGAGSITLSSATLSVVRLAP